MKLLKFSMAHCSPCKLLQGIIDNMDLPCELESIDIDDEPELAMRYNVRGVPTLILVDDSGNEIKRNVGMTIKDDLLEWLK